MIVVTGGAGMIGSAVMWALNQRGREDILMVDDVDHDEKEHNIAPLRYEEAMSITGFRAAFQAGDLDQRGIEAVFHLGAISSTSEPDWDKLLDVNVRYTQELIRWCTDRGIRCIYASSAQTYGAGENGYSDDHERFDLLQTTTLYGKSKLLVDIWARDAGYLEQIAGLRYFNVFGPNEFHKGDMRSVLLKEFPRIRDEGKICLFKSDRADYGDGEQQRDFLYLKDAVAATLFFLDHPEQAGVFNVGTGQAHTWNEVARALFGGLGKEPHIEYVAMPAKLQAGYQYFTQADISKLRAAGFAQAFTPLAEAVGEYVTTYLAPHHHLGEE